MRVRLVSFENNTKFIKARRNLYFVAKLDSRQYLSIFKNRLVIITYDYLSHLVSNVKMVFYVYPNRWKILIKNKTKFLIFSQTNWLRLFNTFLIDEVDKD